MKERFYFACLRDNVGENVAWWSSLGGYTTNVNEAEVFTREKAQSKWEGAREFDLPISADHVDAELVTKVDMQYVPNETQLDDSDCFVGFAKQKYCGNDLYWITETGLKLDFNQAKLFSRAEIPLNESVVFLPYELVKAETRNTFDVSKLNRRKMVQGAGMKTPAHIIKYSRRKAYTKSRFFCPACGKVAWQNNPHTFERCSDKACDGGDY